MTLDLEKITRGFPGITKHMGAFLLEACIVSLSRRKHSHLGTHLLIHGNTEKTIQLVWEDVFDERMDRTWSDQEEATEYGAACLGVLITMEITPYTVIQRSAKGSGVDYWLGHKGDLLMLRKACLEISGIFQGADKVDARFRAKINQVKQLGITGLPTYICVVEFGTPLAKFGEIK